MKLNFAILAWLFLSLSLGTAGSSPAAEFTSESERVNFMIVITGGEILEGAYPDAHTHFLTRTLYPLGLHCVSSITVDDREADIKAALRMALAHVPLVIVTGGLGPTENDITRQTLSSFTGIPLAENEELISYMERRHQMKRDQIRPQLRRQAQTPTRGGFLRSTNGTAAGLIFDSGTNVIVALPGPPRELQPMVKTELVPWLARRFGTHPQTCSLTLRFVGIGQSLIAQTLKEQVVVPPDIIHNSAFDGGRVDYTFSLPSDTPTNRARLKELGAKVVSKLGDYFYADDGSSLEDLVANRLQARQATLALAEVSSGGSLAASLNGGAGIEKVLIGAYAAPTEEGLLRLIGHDESAKGGLDQVVRALRTAHPKPWIVVVGEGQGDGSGPRQVPVVLQSPDGRTKTQRLSLSGTDATSRSFLVTQILDLLRRDLK